MAQGGDQKWWEEARLDLKVRLPRLMKAKVEEEEAGLRLVGAKVDLVGLEGLFKKRKRAFEKWFEAFEAVMEEAEAMLKARSSVPVQRQDDKRQSSVSRQDGKEASQQLQQRETRARLDQKIAENEQLAADKEQLAADKEQLAADKEQLAADKEQLAADNEQLAADKEQLAADKEQLAADNEQLVADKEQLAADNEQLVAENEQLAADKEQLAAEKRQLSQEVRRVQAQHECAEGAFQEKEKQLNQYWKALEIQANKLQLDGKKLGEGSYGVVQVGHWCDVPVAVKTFHEILRLPQLAPVFKRELTVCSQLHHPNLVPIYGGVMKNEIPIQIVMELLQGSLSDLMKAACASKSYHCYLSFREQIDIATDTTAAITYMHCLRPQPYVHCDIRTTNVMITRDMVAKVGDLGASHMINSSTSLGALSLEYCAPEKFPRSDGSSARSTRESDVYSLGVTLTELFTGLSPIPTERRSQIRKIKDPDLLDMCLQMTRDRRADRPTAEMAFTILITQKSTDSYKSTAGRRTVRGNLEGRSMDVVEVIYI